MRPPAALAFEFAGKLQAELEALDWITGEQKVTRAPRGQGDADVYGWADGVLVCFEIRGGRMSGWRQRPCAAAAARRYLDQSPPDWAAFARRNAELAARLRSPQCRTGGSLALAACRTGGAAQGLPSRNLCWVKLYQLPESSRMIASTP